MLAPPCMHTCRASLIGLNQKCRCLCYLMQSSRRAQTASRLTRLQAQSFFQGHQQFVQNAAPVTPYHTQCIQHFMDSGKGKTEAASPAALAVLLQTPIRPANLMKPFRCCPPFPVSFDLNYKTLYRLVADGSGKYRATAALIFAYATSVLGIEGSVCQVFR
jgi:hypothetical protein